MRRMSTKRRTKTRRWSRGRGFVIAATGLQKFYEDSSRDHSVFFKWIQKLISSVMWRRACCMRLNLPVYLCGLHYTALQCTLLCFIHLAIGVQVTHSCHLYSSSQSCMSASMCIQLYTLSIYIPVYLPSTHSQTHTLFMPSSNSIFSLILSAVDGWKVRARACDWHDRRGHHTADHYGGDRCSALCMLCEHQYTGDSAVEGIG